MIYKTSNLQESAALMAQTELETVYVEPEATEDPSRFLFVFELQCTEEDFNEWRTNYLHRRTSVEPKEYDSCLSTIRDTLNIKKPFRRGKV